MTNPLINNSETLLQRFSRFAADVTYESLPPAVIASLKERALDTIGLCLAATSLDTSAMVLKLAVSWGGKEEASVIGAPHRLPAPSAGFVNGTLAHSLDYDDTHLPSVLHPSASIIPGVLAVGESVQAAGGASGKEVLAAAAIGYELCVRSGMAAYDRTLGNSVFFERGWHATSICGTLGVAAAAAKLYGLGAEGIMHAVGIAASMGSGVIEANRTGGSVKRLHCGWAAHAGIIAAQTARAGFTGPPSVLEGRFGFYQAFCGGQFSEAEFLDRLGEYWCIPEIFYKPYPANHFTHAGIDAALRLRERRHQRGGFAVHDEKLPVLGVRRGLQIAKIRHHRGAVFGFVTDAAGGGVQFLAHLADDGFDVAAGAVAFEDRLAVRLGKQLIFFTIRGGHSCGIARQNRCFHHQWLLAHVRVDRDGLEHHAALALHVHVHGNLAGAARGNFPGHRRQLRRGTAA